MVSHKTHFPVGGLKQVRNIPPFLPTTYSKHKKDSTIITTALFTVFACLLCVTFFRCKMMQMKEMDYYAIHFETCHNSSNLLTTIVSFV